MKTIIHEVLTSISFYVFLFIVLGTILFSIFGLFVNWINRNAEDEIEIED